MAGERIEAWREKVEQTETEYEVRKQMEKGRWQEVRRGETRGGGGKQQTKRGGKKKKVKGSERQR